MPYVESRTELREHAKFVKLLDILLVSECQAKGMLQFLWEYLLVNAPDGVLPPHLKGSRLARVCGAPDMDGKRLLRALCASGFLDKTADGYVAHDWENNIGERYIKRKKHAEVMRLSRLKKKQAACSHVMSRDIDQTRQDQTRYNSASTEKQKDAQDSSDNVTDIATPEYVKESVTKIKESLSHVGQNMRVDLSESAVEREQTLEQRLQAAREFCRQQGIEWRGGD